MDKQEVKDEHKQQELPARSRARSAAAAMELARARMMDAVPTADVVVTNPTHYSVALRYDGRAARARSWSPRARTMSRCRIRELGPRARRRRRARPAAGPRAARERRGRPG